MARERPLTLACHDANVRAARVSPGERATEARPVRALLAALVDAIWQLDALCSLARVGDRRWMRAHGRLARRGPCGESLHLAEIRRVSGIVEAVARGDRVMAIFDEVFRGTNISDATEATALLVDGLARAGHGASVIASHIADVAAQRGARAGVSCWRMEVDLDAESPRFTHRITRGVSDVRLGMLLLDAEGIGPLLRAMARGERSSAAPTRTPT